MARSILGFVLAAVLASSAAAQSTWYVDPTSGDNGNTGTSAGDAFLSISFALSNSALASGDSIVLNGGVYNSAAGTNGVGNLSEVFPLQIPNRFPRWKTSLLPLLTAQGAARCPITLDGSNNA